MKDKKLKFNTIGMIESATRHAEKNDTDITTINISFLKDALKIMKSDDLTKIIQNRIEELYELNDESFKNYRNLSKSDKVRSIWKEQLLMTEARRHELERLLKKL